MIIIPAIDLRSGCCVRLTQGRKDSSKVYDENPVAVAKRFEADGAGLLHIVDLDGAFGDQNSSNRNVLREILRTVSIPVQFGGGVRSVPQIKELIDFGVVRVVIGTLAIEAPEMLAKIVQDFGARQIAVGIDASDGQVMSHGWQTRAATDALSLARRLAALGIKRIVYTDVQRDGTLTGPDIDQTCLIAGTGLKVTASGGVSSLEDLKRLKAASGCGIDSVIVGKALYEGRFTVRQAIEVLAE